MQMRTPEQGKSRKSPRNKGFLRSLIQRRLSGEFQRIDGNRQIHTPRLQTEKPRLLLLSSQNHRDVLRLMRLTLVILHSTSLYSRCSKWRDLAVSKHHGFFTYYGEIIKRGVTDFDFLDLAWAKMRKRLLRYMMVFHKRNSFSPPIPGELLHRVFSVLCSTIHTSPNENF